MIARLQTPLVASWAAWHVRLRRRSRWASSTTARPAVRPTWGRAPPTDCARLTSVGWARWMGVRQGVAVARWPPADRGTRPRTCADSDRPWGGDNAMTSSAAAGQRGFRHELLLHRSTKELVEFVVPMVREGVVAQEPTLLLVRPETAEAVRHQVGTSPYLTVQPALAQPGRPALHVRAAPLMLASYARVVHQEPVIPPAQWPGWRRLEAVLNLALSHHDTWAVCAYDRRTLTDEMVADLHATHPLIALNGSHQRSDRYQHPVDFLKHHRDSPCDPVERTAPAVELVDPSPATA